VSIVYREQPWRRERLTPECSTGHGQRPPISLPDESASGDGGGRTAWRLTAAAAAAAAATTGDYHHHRCNTSLAERSAVVE